MNKEQIKFFAMPNIQKLGISIAEKLNIPISKINKIVFADKETCLNSEKTVRNKSVYILASTCFPTNENLMELLIFIDSLKRASAKTISVIFTYYGYSRQDRKSKKREPITARLVADLLEKTGVSQVIAVGLHNPSIQGFFNVPFDELKGEYILASSIKKYKNFMIASPDHGGTIRTRALAEMISDSTEIVIIDKRRIGINKIISMSVIGEVKNKNIVILDDIIDTGTTIIEAAKLLKKNGAKKIIVAATHGIFSQGFKKFDESKIIDKVIITDSIEKIKDIKSSKLEIVSLNFILAKTIKALTNAQSLNEVYTKILLNSK